MGQKAFKEKLNEIKMSEYDAFLYEKFSNAVSKEVQSIRTLLENLEITQTERVWFRHQTSGVIDDGKLIDGLLGKISYFFLEQICLIFNLKVIKTSIENV